MICRGGATDFSLIFSNRLFTATISTAFQYIFLTDFDFSLIFHIDFDFDFSLIFHTYLEFVQALVKAKFN